MTSKHGHVFLKMYWSIVPSKADPFVRYLEHDFECWHIDVVAGNDVKSSRINVGRHVHLKEHHWFDHGEDGATAWCDFSTASCPSSTFTEYGHYVIDAFGSSNLLTNLTCYPKSISFYILSVFFSKVCTPGVVLSQGSISFVKVSMVGFGNSPGSNRPKYQPNYLFVLTCFQECFSSCTDP